MKKTPINAAFMAPSLLKDLSQNAEALDYCSKRLDRILYAGGDLPQPVGDAIASKVRLVNRYGASEMGFPNQVYSANYRDAKRDWRYIQFHPSLGQEFRQVTDQEYELVFVRTPEGEAHCPVWTIFPELQEYHTKDLWVCHPERADTEPALWRYSARADDVIVFLNGEKTNPISMEHHITAANADVTGVLVAGAQRFQASLFVEVSGGPYSASERAGLIERIWPSVEEANAQCPAHARIDKAHILFTKEDRPILRTGKGTVRRAATLALYAEELDALYSDAEWVSAEMNGHCSDGPGRVNDVQVVAMYVRQVLTSATGWKMEQLSDGDNLFHLGLDSLQAMAAARRLAQGLAFPEFTVNMIYLHPSISQLSQAIICHQQNQGSSKEALAEAELNERDAMLQEFLDQIRTDKDTERHTVVLTGSTGTLGTYLLDTLLKTPSIDHVYCLNRSTDSISAQRKKSSLYNLNIPIHSRVTFWTTDFSQQDLGVSPDALSTLQRETTLIIHNAWAVNFNLSLSSFQPQLTGVINLLNLASCASKSPRLFFISSISSVMGHSTASKTTPDELISTTSPAPNGYATSKYLTEHLLAHGAKTRNLRTAFARVGQVAGAAKAHGLWNKNEWFPSLVLSSLHVGAVPDTVSPKLDRVDWVPVDLLAEVLVELALSDCSDSTAEAERTVEVFHPHNLNLMPWNEAIRPVIADALAGYAGKQIETVPLVDWIERVRRDLEGTGTGGSSDNELQVLLERDPAAKLLGFFEGLADSASAEPDNVLETGKTAQRSERLRAVPGVKAEWVRKWVGKWVGEWLA